MADKPFQQVQKFLAHRLRKKEEAHEDEDEGGRGRSGSGGSSTGRKRPRETYLGEDTEVKENKRRALEIKGLIASTGLSSEARRDRDFIREKSTNPDAGLDEGIPKHPILGDKQQYDGLDPEVNPIPALTSQEALEAYQLEQQLKMQKRLELQKRMDNTATIKPRGP